MTTLQPSAVTAARSDLFLLAARALAARRAGEHGDRLSRLVAALAADDAWMSAFIGWARRQPALRLLALAVAAEFLHTRLTARLATPAVRRPGGARARVARGRAALRGDAAGGVRRPAVGARLALEPGAAARAGAGRCGSRWSCRRPTSRR
ncbi:hypothetical protein [Nonomuraea aridisoli]|uniref:hypothetical protein n=1 Tax=Nonomuraea aridisoli TaxID=2070368 RepID=UPI0011B9416A|nr:hypothetical protein [Nonomuraea aridisoli]